MAGSVGFVEKYGRLCGRSDASVLFPEATSFTVTLQPGCSVPKRGTLVAIETSGRGNGYRMYAVGVIRYVSPQQANGKRGLCCDLIGKWYDGPTKLTPHGSVETPHPHNLWGIGKGQAAFAITGDARKHFESAYAVQRDYVVRCGGKVTGTWSVSR